MFFQILKKYKNGIENPAATSFRKFNSLYETKTIQNDEFKLTIIKNDEKKNFDFPIDFYAIFHFFDFFGKISDISSLLVTHFFHDAETS